MPLYKRGKEHLGSQFKSIHEIPVNDIDGNHIERLGEITVGLKCIMVVNVASKWGFAKSIYSQLVELHREYRDKGFEILAFPCDQFLSQEPGTNSDIKKLIIDKFKAEFPLFEKSEINGANTCEVYKYLRYNTEALYDPENDVV